MTGQEKYESEKERKEAQKMADANREAVRQHEQAIKGSEDTAAVFRKQARQAREFAELLRKL
jgi:superfamily I DNA/RNA helicase